MLVWVRLPHPVLNNFNIMETSKITSIDYAVCSSFLTIYDSYKIEDEDEMIRIIVGFDELNGRSAASIINEWKSHNLLYNMGMFIKHTRHLDIEYNIKWYMDIFYCFSAKIWDLWQYIKSKVK